MSIIVCFFSLFALELSYHAVRNQLPPSLHGICNKVNTSLAIIKFLFIYSIYLKQIYKKLFSFFFFYFDLFHLRARPINQQSSCKLQLVAYQSKLQYRNAKLALRQFRNCTPLRTFFSTVKYVSEKKIKFKKSKACIHFVFSPIFCILIHNNKLLQP